MITKTKFSNCPNVWFSSKINILLIKLRFKSIRYLQSRENLYLLLSSLIFFVFKLGTASTKL